MSDVKVCCKNCNAHSYRWCLFDKWKNIMSEEEMSKERECEKFNPTLSAIAEATDGELYIVVGSDK